METSRGTDYTACTLTFMSLHITGIDDKIKNPHSDLVYTVFCAQQHKANLTEMEQAALLWI